MRDMNVWDPFANFEKHILPNGLTVYHSTWENRTWHSVGFIVHSGAYHDPIGKEGTAHFLEHLVSHSSGLSQEYFVEVFTHAGGSVNLGSTSYGTTEYKFRVPASKETVSESLLHMGNALIYADIHPFLEEEREVIFGEYKNIYPFDFTEELAWKERQALYKGHWMERFIRPMGTPTSIKTIQEQHLRDFYDTHYTPSNMTLISIGGMSQEDMLDALLQSPFGSEKEGKRMAMPSPIPAAPAISENSHSFSVSEHTSVSADSARYQSLSVVPGTVSLYALVLFQNILQDILMRELRTVRSWCYDVSVTRSHFYDVYELKIATDSLKTEALDTVESVVTKCIEEAGENTDLFESRKSQELNAFSLADYNGAQVLRSAMADIDAVGEILKLNDEYASVSAVPQSEMKVVAEMLRRDRRWSLSMRP